MFQTDELPYSDRTSTNQYDILFLPGLDMACTAPYSVLAVVTEWSIWVALCMDEYTSIQVLQCAIKCFFLSLIGFKLRCTSLDYMYIVHFVVYYMH